MKNALILITKCYTDGEAVVFEKNHFKVQILLDEVAHVCYKLNLPIVVHRERNLIKLEENLKNE
jgi:hypothetical protein